MPVLDATLELALMHVIHRRPNRRRRDAAEASQGRAPGISAPPTAANAKGDGMDVGGLGDKAKSALDSEQGEKRSDQALDKAEQMADEKTGGKYDAQTDKVGDVADQRTGQSDAGQGGT